MAVALSSGSNGHFAMAFPIPGNDSYEDRWDKFAWKNEWTLKLDGQQEVRSGFIIERPEERKFTHIKDPIPWTMGVCTTDIQSVTIVKRLNNANMISAIEML